MNKKLTQKAVALKYSQENDNAPKVVAKGKGYIADKIKELAIGNDIPIKEDSDLVQILEAIDLNSEIPIEAFSAVAEILSYIYKQNAELKNSYNG